MRPYLRSVEKEEVIATLCSRIAVLSETLDGFTESTDPNEVALVDQERESLVKVVIKLRRKAKYAMLNPTEAGHVYENMTHRISVIDERLGQIDPAQTVDRDPLELEQKRLQNVVKKMQFAASK